MFKLYRLIIALGVLWLAFTPVSATAAPYAAEVVDARTGRILYSTNANTKLHPASLTKMMTLYISFAEVKSGRMSLGQRVRFSNNAAKEPYGIMGAKEGTTVELRYLMRAAAIRSSNDSATAIGEAIAGSEAAFVRYMNETARRLGMKNTQFKNAHGLTQSGHYSTAHDMALLGRRLIYDFPEYYNVFSRRSAETPMGKFPNTNRGFLNAYSGSDGIKTGYTSAAGYNLVASARRGNERIIVSMFGGKSVAQRNKQVATLMDLGFSKAPSRVAFVPMSPVRLTGPGTTTRVASAPAPKPTPTPAPEPSTAPARETPHAVVSSPQPQQQVARRSTDLPRNIFAPRRRIAISTATASVISAGAIPQMSDNEAATIEAAILSASGGGINAPARRPTRLASASISALETVSQGSSIGGERVRASSSTGNYAIQLADLNTRSAAEKMLISTTLEEVETLEGARNGIVTFARSGGGTGYRPRFSGLSASAAKRACARLQARSEECFIIAP